VSASRKAKTQWVWIKALTPEIQAQTERRITAHAAKILPEKAHQIRVRFKTDSSSEYCYIDADEGKGPPLTHLCRLGWRGDLEQWDLAFYTYSNEQYQPCLYGTGEPLGTPEEALEVGIVYLG
jgi:hypothetical protein